MTDVSGTSYQPAVAYQGGPVNTPMQELKSGQTQPKQAPAADTQRGDLEKNDKRPSSYDRGTKIDVSA
ncbi:MAG: hypothetical protein V1721_10175 [Pseudomonadota bacterium]